MWLLSSQRLLRQMRTITLSANTTTALPMNPVAAAVLYVSPAMDQRLPGDFLDALETAAAL